MGGSGMSAKMATFFFHAKKCSAFQDDAGHHDNLVHLSNSWEQHLKSKTLWRGCDFTVKRLSSENIHIHLLHAKLSINIMQEVMNA